MKRFSLLSAILLLVVLAFASTSTSDAVIRHYRNIADNEALSITKRLTAIDSLRRCSPSDCELEIKRITLLNDDFCVATTLPLLDSLINTIEDSQISLRCRLLVQLMRASSLSNDYSSTYSHAVELLNMPKPDSLRYFDLKAYSMLAEVSLENEDPEATENYLQLALKRAEEVEWPSPQEYTAYVVSIYGQRCTLYLSEGRVEEAYREIEKMQKLPLDSGQMVSSYVSLGSIYDGMGRRDIANAYYRRAVESGVNNINRVTALVLLAQNMFISGDPEGADSLLNENRALLTTPSSTSNASNIDIVLASIKAAKGDYKAAYGHMVKAWELAQDVKDGQKKLSSIISRRQIQLLEAARRDGRLKHRYMLLASVAAGVALALGAIVAALWRNRRRSRIAFEERAEAVRTLDLMAQSLEREGLKSADITNAYTSLRDTLNHLCDIVAGGQTPAAKIEAIKREMKRNDVAERLLVTDRKIREITDPSLLASLHSNYPTLTKGELEMCMFIRSGYSTRQIAEMTYRSARTVEVVKHNLRRKMAVPEDITTAAFLSNLSRSRMGTSAS